MDEYPAAELERGGHFYLAIVILLVTLLSSRHVDVGFRSQGAEMCF